jgi:plasmid stabilization system protein ParE
MAREVVWASSASDDLAAIVEFIRRDSEHYAASLTREIVRAAGSLGDMAERGQIVPEFQDEQIRELLIRQYRLIYRVRDQVVLVLAIVHGARRWKR